MNYDNMTLGANLSPADRAYVLKSFVHRFTGDTTPLWAKQPKPNGAAYPLPFLNDQDWLANTKFLTTKAGRLDKRARSCDSIPTWPGVEK
jgi:hypothetical protein